MFCRAGAHHDSVSDIRPHSARRPGLRTLQSPRLHGSLLEGLVGSATCGSGAERRSSKSSSSIARQDNTTLLSLRGLSLSAEVARERKATKTVQAVPTFRFPGRVQRHHAVHAQESGPAGSSRYTEMHLNHPPSRFVSVHLPVFQMSALPRLAALHKGPPHRSGRAKGGCPIRPLPPPSMG